MSKLIISLTALSAIYISGCAQSHEENSTESMRDNKLIAVEPSTYVIANRDEQPLRSTDKAAATEASEVTMTHIYKEYWVKRVDTLVYNSRHEAVRSLRLQPKVKIEKEVDGWGLVDANKDEWIKMSDVTHTQPAEVLSWPQDSTGNPRLTAEEMMQITESK